MWDLYASRAVRQAPMGGKIRSKHADKVAETGCLDSNKVHGGNLQPHRRLRSGMIEEMDFSNYLLLFLHRSDEGWPEVCRNIRRARQVWGHLGTFLIRKGTDPIVSAKFYRALVQAVLLFGE